MSEDNSLKHVHKNVFVKERYGKKVVVKGFSSQKRMEREFDALTILKSVKGVPRLLSCDKSVINMEYLGEDSLIEILTRWKDQEIDINDRIKMVKKITVDLLTILHQAHKLNVCHRDLKLENIMIFNGQTYLIDWDLSEVFLPGELLSGRCGTKDYMSPEMIIGASYDPEFTDVWSLGVVVFAMMTYMLPFKSEFKNRFQVIREGIKNLTEECQPYGDWFCDFIHSMLAILPEKRSSMEKLLQHPWIN